MKDIKELLKTKVLKADKRNSYEFQAYANKLAEEMGEPDKRGLYMRIVKKEDRNLVETAREYIKLNENATTKGKLFVWKLNQLKKAKQNKVEANN